MNKQRVRIGIFLMQFIQEFLVPAYTEIHVHEFYVPWWTTTLFFNPKIYCKYSSFWNASVLGMSTCLQRGHDGLTFKHSSIQCSWMHLLQPGHFCKLSLSTNSIQQTQHKSSLSFFSMVTLCRTDSCMMSSEIRSFILSIICFQESSRNNCDASVAAVQYLSICAEASW